MYNHDMEAKLNKLSRRPHSSKGLEFDGTLSEKMEEKQYPPGIESDEEKARCDLINKIYYSDSNGFLESVVGNFAKHPGMMDRLIAEERTRTVRLAAETIALTEKTVRSSNDFIKMMLELPSQDLEVIARLSSVLQQREVIPTSEFVNEVMELATVMHVLEENKPDEDKSELVSLFRPAMKVNRGSILR